MSGDTPAPAGLIEWDEGDEPEPTEVPGIDWPSLEAEESVGLRHLEIRAYRLMESGDTRSVELGLNLALDLSALRDTLSEIEGLNHDS